MPTLKENDTVRFKRHQRARFALRDGFLASEKEKDLIRNLPIDNPSGSTDYILDGLESGEFSKLDVFEDGKKVGLVVYQIEEDKNGKELLIIAAAGTGTDLSRNIIPLLEVFALSRECTSLRLHTMRTGLVKKLSELDWFVSEIVLRKELK